MSRYRAALDAEIQRKPLSHDVAKVSKGALDTLGTDRGRRVFENRGRVDESSDTFGTEVGRRVSENAPDPADLAESLAMAAESGVPVPYADVWARLQLQRPAGTDEKAWRQALDAGGRFLDAWGELAVTLGWAPGDIFDVPRSGRGGLIWMLAGEAVRALGPEHAVTESDRVFDRLDRSCWAGVAEWIAAQRGEFLEAASRAQAPSRPER